MVNPSAMPGQGVNRSAAITRMIRKAFGITVKAIEVGRAGMSPPPWRMEAATCQDVCLELLLHFLGFFLNFLTASLDVLACTLDRIARGQRNRGKRRKAKYEFLEHGISLNLSNWGDSIHPHTSEQSACQYQAMLRLGMCSRWVLSASRLLHRAAQELL